MSVLLAVDTVALYRPGPPDAHGWVTQGAGRPYWTGQGSLQLGPGPSDPRAADGGGHGPFGPGASRTGNLYLPPSVPPAEGDLALIRGTLWALSQVRFVPDPAGTGDLDCYVATAATAPGGDGG